MNMMERYFILNSTSLNIVWDASRLESHTEELNRV